MGFNFEGSVLIVTGAGSGIGRSTSVLLAKLGAQVVTCDRDPNALTETTKAAGDCAASLVPAECDISKEDDVLDLARQMSQKYGRIDGLVNNAGVWWPERDGRLTSVDLETWDHMLRINLTGTYLMCREIIPMLSAGGAVVNVASAAAVTGWPEMDAYTASKGGVLSMTRSMAVEFGPDIRVNAICPGAIATPLTMAEQDRVGIPKNPLRRPGKPDEIAWPIAFLLSTASSFITGEYIMADGGRRASL